MAGSDEKDCKMTEANIIALNTLASYGRSLLGLCLGLFSTRWVLAALGKDDLGLFGLVGSCVVFVTLFNGIMGGTVARFYAYALGERKKMPDDDGRRLMTEWFNAAFSVHAFLPVILAVIVYPLGVYALRHWLVVPPERVVACTWAFRLVLLSACVGMASVPYVAMYRAKQMIVELSVWEAARTVAAFVCAYALLFWPHDRLVAYAAYMTLIPVGVCAAQMIRARLAFDGCVIRPGLLFSAKRLRPMMAYAFGDFFGSLGSVIRDNGTAVLVNLNFGPAANAAFGIANQVSQHTTALSNAMIGAMVPAVTTSEGEGDHAHAVRLSFRSIKFGVSLILVFCIPLMLEMDEVLRLWLVNPPEGTAMLCRCMLLAFVCLKLGWGHQLAIMAKGKVVLAQMVFGTTAASALLVAWVLIRLGMGLVAVGASFVAVFSLMTIERVAFARYLCGMPAWHWAARIVAPLIAAATLSAVAGYAVTRVMSPSLLRVCATSAVSALTLMSCLPVFLFDGVERAYLLSALRRVRPF